MSPIEEELYAAIMETIPPKIALEDFSEFPSWIEICRDSSGKLMAAPHTEYNVDTVLCGETDPDENPTWVLLNCQIPVFTYRADILLTIRAASGNEYLIVECDGHDWHERTKQQAAYDRSRDRELLAEGIYTIRFTGSEIHHSANRCAQDVWRTVARLIKKCELIERVFDESLKLGTRLENDRNNWGGVFGGSLSELG